MRALTFRKRERLVSQRLIDELFGGGNSRSLAAYPLRAVYLQKERQDHHTSLQLLIDVLPADSQLLVALVWLSDSPLPTAAVEERIASLVKRISEKI